jgi:hypothetical protein
VLDDPCPNRIEDNMPTDLEQMGILLHENRLIAALKYVPGSSVSAVEFLGVYAIQLTHSFGKVSVRSLNEKVVVIVHEAVRVTNPIIALHKIPEDGEKCLPVNIIEEDRSPPISSCCQMIKRSRKLDSQWSGHGLSLART